MEAKPSKGGKDMQYRYVPLLKWQRGEKRALKAVKEKMAKDVIPVITVTDETFADQPETVRHEAVKASVSFADELMARWGARPFYLNASAIQPSARGVHPLIDTAKQCREQGARLTPAITLNASEAYEAAVIEVDRIDKAGVALIVNLDEFNSLEEWMSNWPHAPQKTDLIVDLGDNVSAVSALGSVLQIAFRNLHCGAEWRTVTMAGTSMPENFSDYERDGVYLIERKEWRIWQQLIASTLPYRLDYGDYATPPIREEGVTIRYGFPINVRYTLTTHFLIPRGVRTLGEGSRDQGAQLVSHAKTIVSYKKRGRLDCWGDEEIDKIANEKVRPGNLENWTKIGINRHIARVRTDLP
jgi:hypothetical protein